MAIETIAEEVIPATTHPESAFKAEDHYFSINGNLLTEIFNSLVRKEILMYLLHARSANPKHQCCSFASYEKARRCLGLPYLAVDAANAGLIAKGLLKPRLDVRTAYYKTIAMEVLQSEEARQGSIFLPSSIVDDGVLQKLTNYQLNVLLFLYKHCRWEASLGVDFQVVHLYNNEYARGIRRTNRVFEGIHSKVDGEVCYAVPKSEDWYISPIARSLFGNGIAQALNKLLTSGLIYEVPLVIQENPEDKDIATVRYEVMYTFGYVFGQERCRNPNTHVLPPLREERRVIWAIRPQYVAKNSDYQSFLIRERAQLNKWEELYRDE